MKHKSITMVKAILIVVLEKIVLDAVLNLK